MQRKSTLYVAVLRADSGLSSSSSPVVIDIIEKVRDQGDAFYWAIEISIEAAQHGHRFCKDFSTIVEHLNDRRVTTKELREIISDMYAVAKKARRNAQDVVQLFRNMRQGLYTVCHFESTASRTMLSNKLDFERSSRRDSQT